MASLAPAAAADGAASSSYEKLTLFDVPVSNNGARIRAILYKKGLEGDVDVRSPKDLGGLRSAEFLALNPLGKMPALALPDGSSLYESQVIEAYMLDKFADHAPSLQPPTPELRARAALAVRLHDLYIAPVQGCMYRQMPSAEQRATELAQIAAQLDILEGLVIGRFICGEELSYADTALLPTFVFLTHILPRHFGWSSVFTRRPKLEAWWAAVGADAACARVAAEVGGALQVWEAEKRWESRGIDRHVADGSYNWSCDT